MDIRSRAPRQLAADQAATATRQSDQAHLASVIPTSESKLSLFSTLMYHFQISDDAPLMLICLEI